jgi:aldehyde dehydrogenase (NAD+)
MFRRRQQATVRATDETEPNWRYLASGLEQKRMTRMDDIGDLLQARQHWIGGEWRPSRGSGLFEVVDPSTEQVLGVISSATGHDVDDAVRAASRALPAWSQTPLEERLLLLERLCDVIDDSSGDFASLITQEVGAPVAISAPMHVGLALQIFRSFIALGRQLPLEERVGESLLLREPVGVVACITPWNLPLILIAQKLAPALVAGCTVVLKPSELTPFNALWLARAAHKAGYPPGTFNVVTGDGPTAGEALVQHPDVSKISFTGSTRAGRRIAALAAGTVKRVGLELGGKSANVILEDGELERAITTGVHQACFNSGQSCIAWSRILVPRSRLADAVDLATGVSSGLKVGDPHAPDTELGPLVSQAAMSRVHNYIRNGLDEGASIATGGTERPAHLPCGYYVSPTVFSGVTPEMTIAREEIFGPVVCILTYDSEEEAVAIANSTEYGLHGSVWSEDEGRALSVARRIRTGMLNINGYGFDAMAPFGGCKQSGLGRELGTAGLEEFFEIKVVQTLQA